jgi:3-oxoacyl-[acyl-carrier-protein] synthase II
MENVAITGVGVISAVGLDFASFTEHLDAGAVGIEAAPWADPASGAHAWIAKVHGFDPTDWMDERVAAGSGMFAHFGIAAAVQAVADSGVELPPLRTAVIFGTAQAGGKELLEAQRLYDTVGREAIPRKLNLQAWPQATASQVAMRWQLHGPLLTLSTACAASLDAIGMGARMIEAGVVDVVIAGGAESGLCETLYYSQALYGMSQPTADRNRACLPFDVARSGVVEGEGAGVVVLERADAAARRGARVYGRVRGYGSLSDAFHPSSPNPTGEWEALAIANAQREAALPGGPAAIQAVVAHGTATPVGDAAEIRAINSVFGDRSDDLYVTSIKGAVGHTAGAAGSMGLIAGLHGMATGTLVHTANTTEVEPDAQFIVPLEKPARVDIEALQVNGFGFGGHNASLVVTRS